MITFRIWLENREKNIRDTILTLLGLDEDGLETPLESLKSDQVLSKLEPLGMWNSLPAEKQAAIKSMIKQNLGTVGELINKIVELGDVGIETPGVMPHRDEM